MDHGATEMKGIGNTKRKRKTGMIGDSVVCLAKRSPPGQPFAYHSRFGPSSASARDSSV
jgi:hypothetical protein